MTRDPKLAGLYARDELAVPNKYTAPRAVFIGSGGEATKLYRQEEFRNDAIKACALEWARLNHVPAEQYWSRTIPQALFDTLEAYQTTCSILAAKAFLEHYGWKVTPPEMD